MCPKLEADFRQYYYADLRDVLDPESGVTIRWVLDMLDELPHDSRFKRFVHNDPLDSEEHLLISIIDVLNQIFYQTSLSAASQVGKNYSKYLKKAPKDIERPKYKVVKVEKPKFLSGAELKTMFNS